MRRPVLRVRITALTCSACPSGSGTCLANIGLSNLTEAMAARSTESRDPVRAPRSGRVRMTGAQRREQLIVVSRSLFADRGFEGTSIEEIAARAKVS